MWRTASNGGSEITAFSNASGCAMSGTIVNPSCPFSAYFAYASLILSALSCDRTVVTTEWPWRRSTSRVCAAIKPLPPVKRTLVILDCVWGGFEDDVRRNARIGDSYVRDSPRCKWGWHLLPSTSTLAWRNASFPSFWFVSFLASFPFPLTNAIGTTTTYVKHICEVSSDPWRTTLGLR